MSHGSAPVSGCEGLTITIPSSTYAEGRLVGTADHSIALKNMGTEFTLEDGRIYKYVRAVAGITIGQIVYRTAHVTGTLSAGSAIAATSVTSTSAFTANYYADQKGDYYITFLTNTGSGQTRRIIANTASVLTLDAGLTTAVDNTTTFYVWSPALVAVTTTTGQQVTGVAIGTISTGNYGWIQIKGYCPLVQVVGNTNPTIAQELIQSSATGGYACGRTAGGLSVADVDNAFGYALAAYSNAASLGLGIDAIIHCI